MQSKTRQRLMDHALWLSFLGHSLFFLSFITFISLQPVKKADLLPASISSYAVSSLATPAVTAATPTPPSPQKAPVKPLKPTKAVVEKPVKAQPTPAKQQTKARRVVSFSAASPPIDLTHPYDQEPLRLIGESKIVPPLVRILARAIGPHLFYPRVAAELNLKGVVLVGFVLHPEGYLTDARIVKSSGAGVLDDAARNGVAAVSSVGQVSEFIQQPEFLVIGVIFG